MQGQIQAFLMINIKAPGPIQAAVLELIRDLILARLRTLMTKTTGADRSLPSGLSMKIPY